MSLLELYEAAIARGEIHDSRQQREVLSLLQSLQKEVEGLKAFQKIWRKKTSPRGIYLYGPVGVGKTYLMDLFYQALAIEQKKRFHFHHFMQQIDSELRELQGSKDPLLAIAAQFANTVQVLCLDEFLVNDVAQAMILAELLQALFKNGIVLIATSNTAPDDLYRNGVQRERFLPAIALIKTHCHLLSLDDHRDYRFEKDFLTSAYLYPLDNKTTKTLAQQFARYAEEVEGEGIITIQNRQIPFIKRGRRAIWFDFKIICNVPRSQLDYLEIAERFDTLFISDIPQLTPDDTIPVVLFIRLIDILYDRGTKLLISAEVPLEKLYLEGEMLTAFKRTRSRLQEMQSCDYGRRDL